MMWCLQVGGCVVDETEGIAIPISYVGIDDLTVAHANHFVLQFDRGDFILTVGQVFAPLLLGDDEEQRQQVEQIAYVPARPLGRFALTRGRVQELRDLLDKHLARFEASQGEGES